MLLNQDRRRSPRLPVANAASVPQRLRDVSLEGFSIETPEALPTNSVHDFDLNFADGSLVVLRGRVVHSRREPAPDGADVFVTGVAFLEEVSATSAARIPESRTA